MLLSHSCSSLFYPSIKPSVAKSNVPFSSNHPKMNGSYFTRRRHTRPSQLLAAAAAASDDDDVHAGIEILEYFEGKNIFVTGATATGLPGKAYANEKREGIILEEPLIMGEIGRNNNGGEQQQQQIDVADEISLLLKSSTDHDTTKFFRKLGQQSCHPPALEVTAAATAIDNEDGHAGIGILDFFEGKNIFVTGATALLGKVIVEKILRSTPVGKVYLLIKAKDKEAAFDRLKCEVISSELLKCLKEKYGNSYEAFIRAKLIPVVGDICEPNLGMDYECIDSIRKDVHLIIHSAASTTFNGRYDLLVDANVIAPQRLMRFAKTCNKLHLFTHISTAYVNERREGLILEEPLIMGEIGRNNNGGEQQQIDVADEISLLLKSSADHDATKFFKSLGQQRAGLFGWSTTYQLSKAMGEMALNEIKGDVPLLKIRPSIIESCYREPVPGWIQGMRMSYPVITSYGKGKLPAFAADPQVPLDLIPVDLVANTTIAAIAKHGNIDNHMGEPSVYHVASSFSNPITAFDFFEYLYEYFKTTPLIESANIAKLKIFDNFEEFSKFTREEIVRNYGDGEDRKRIRECNAKVESAEQLCKIYQFVAFFKARFHTGNTQKLIEEMSKEEQLNFEVDIRNIDWKMYLQKVHIPGLIKYVIKSPIATSRL